MKICITDMNIEDDPIFSEIFGTLKKPREELTDEQKAGLELMKIAKQFNKK